DDLLRPGELVRVPQALAALAQVVQCGIRRMRVEGVDRAPDLLHLSCRNRVECQPLRRRLELDERRLEAVEQHRVPVSVECLQERAADARALPVERAQQASGCGAIGGVERSGFGAESLEQDVEVAYIAEQRAQPFQLRGE